MNLRRLILSGALALTTFNALANNGLIETQPYRYGMDLDIAKVIAINEPQSTECKVVEATMKFINHAGKIEQISYRKQAMACNLQN